MRQFLIRGGGKLRKQAQRAGFWRMVICGLGLLLSTSLALAQLSNTGVSAQAIGQANLRAEDSVEAQLVGEITAGNSYPVLGRSELYPWLLLGEIDSEQPKGWVYESLVVINGDVNDVPFSDWVIETAVATATPISLNSSAEVVTAAVATGTSFAVTGTVLGEVNIRHGPGIDYPRVGVAYPGDRFEVTGYHTQFPWLRINYADGVNNQAWIARDLLEISGDIFSTSAVSQARFSLPPLTPTPSPIRASGINQKPAQTLSQEFLRLADQLWDLLFTNDFDPQTSRFGALFVMDLASGEAFTIGDQFAFSGTSLNKIAILAKLYLRLETPPSIETATDILNTMICSDNSATNRLLSIIGDGNSYFGAEAVTAFYQQLGLSRSFLTAPFSTIGTPEPPPHPILLLETDADQDKADPDLSNQLTVSDIGALLVNLYQCAYQDSGALNESFGNTIEGRECRQMLHVMSNNTVDALLKSGVPADTRVAHKHGWIADTHGNAALFFTPGGDYVVTMILYQPEWLNFQESLPLFAEISRRIYNYFNPQQPQEADREWTIPDVNSCNYFGDPLIADLLQWTWDQ